MAASLQYNEAVFQQKLQEALGHIRTVLDNTRAPQLPDQVSHTYTDKFLLAEFLGNTAFGGFLYDLEALGLDTEGLDDMRNWARKRSVSLRFEAEERCTFDRKVERKVESATKNVTEISHGSRSATITNKTVTKVTDYFWKYEVDYELFAFQGNNLKKKLEIRKRHCACEIKTSSESPPRPSLANLSPIDVNITDLLQRVSEELQVSFTIDRTTSSCHTPRRNTDVTTALSQMHGLLSWAGQVKSYLQSRLFPQQADSELDMTAMNKRDIFNPVLPLFEADREADQQAKTARGIITVIDADREASTEDSIAALRSDDANILLQEQARTTQDVFTKLAKVYPAGSKLITKAEAELVVVLSHVEDLAARYYNGVDYIEGMLYAQLREAIGKDLTPVEFTEYMAYHNRKLFKDEYQPQPFCFAVRRPSANPQGVVGVECSLKDGSVSEPIATLVNAEMNVTRPMHFHLNAAAKVSFLGDRYLHAWVGHQFSGESGAKFNLSARARQFSCYIMLVGTIAAADLFVPKFGVIVQNKDEYLLPLLFEQIPTPQAFRDAIESLSPEQQRFAKAFRSMQLESTLFGVTIIQIKPQLERLLNLPVDSLTKEIQLTQDLLNLFIEYQIPSDLVSFEARDFPDASPAQRIEIVKGHVANMQLMIKTSKERELAEVKETNAFLNPLKEEELRCDLSEPLPKFERKFKKSKKKSASILPKLRSKARLSASSISVSAAPSSAPSPVQAPAPEAPAPSEAVSEPVDSNKQPSNEFEVVEGEEEGIDVTQMPTRLDANFDKYDEDNSLHSTIIKPDTTWRKKFLKSLLAKPEDTILGVDELKKEKNATFDLLDALTRSGSLDILDASLHVVLASTHCFDETLVDTVIQKNVNPIEKVERSVLIVASTIHSKPAAELVHPSQLERVQAASPNLFQE